MFLANITPVLKLLFTRAQVKPDKSGKGLSHVIFHGVAVICSHLQQEAEMMRRCVTHQQPQSWGTLPLPALHHFCQLPVITLPASGERCLLDHNKQCLCHMKSFFFFPQTFPIKKYNFRVNVSQPVMGSQAVIQNSCDTFSPELSSSMNL